MPRFLRMTFRGQKVWAEVGPDGQPAADGEGRVEIRYKLEDARAYRANTRNLLPIAGAEPVPAAAVPAAAAPAGATKHPAPRKRTARRGRSAAPAGPATVSGSGPATVSGHGPATVSGHGPATATVSGRGPATVPPIVIYTDGACSGNPGPMGIGVVLIAGEQRKEISEYLGMGTNNVAELTAILRALDAVKDRERPVLVHCDSEYAIGVVSRGWKVKANQDLVARIRSVGATFRTLRFVKVAGHADVPENERCDELARDAVARGA